jgi:hypothetical protein
MSHVFDLTEVPQFRKEEWIGKGLIYPKDPQKLDLGLAYYCQSQLEIPTHIQHIYFPHENLSVEAFLVHQLPNVVISLVAIKTVLCFHPCRPNDDERQLGKRDIPSKIWIQAMYTEFNQAVLDGMQSVEDPRYPGSYLLLWSIGFWKQMLDIVEVQSTWRGAVAWLGKEAQCAQPTTRQLMDTAHSYTKSLRWNESTRISGAGTYTTTYAFASFLSNNSMMATDHINMIFAHLGDCAESDEATDEFLTIENLQFIHEIEKANEYSYWDSPSPSFLRRLEERALHNKLTAMVFPVYVAKVKHWLAFRIDFENEELAYGTQFHLT